MKMYYWLGALLVLLIVGCAGTPQVSDEVLNSKYAGQAPSDALRMVDARVSAAKSEKLDFYSPGNFKDAQEALLEAKAIAKDKPNSRDILKYTFVADQFLDRGYQVAKSVKYELKDIFNQQQILESNQVGKSFNEDYQALLDDVREIVADIEKIKRDKPEGKNAFAAIKDEKNALLNHMMALNIRVVKHNSLAASKSDLDVVQKADAKNLAPLTLQTALDALQAANQFIENNVSDRDGVAQVAEVFRFSVQHLIQVNDAVLALTKTNKKDYEKLVLAQEQKLLLISKALNYKDLRDMPIEKQASILAHQASHVSQQLVGKNQEYTDLIQQRIALEDKINQDKQTTAQSSKQLDRNVSELTTKIATLEQERALLKGQVNQLQQKVVQLAINNSELAANESSATDEAFKMHDLPPQSDIEHTATKTAVDIKPTANKIAEGADKLDKKNVANVSQ